MKKGLIALALLAMPLTVSAKVTSSTEARDANSAAESAIREDMKLNDSSIKNVTSGYYLEGLKIDCSINKYTHTIMNDIDFKSELTCANGNKAPYIDIISDGTSSVPIGGNCNSTESLYASRVYAYDCNYTGTKDNKTQYVSNNKGNITVIANNGVSFAENTSESSGTYTINKNTGSNLNATCTDKCELSLNLKISSGYKLLGSSRDNCSTINEAAIRLEKIMIEFDKNTNDTITLCTQATNSSSNKDTGTTDNKDTGVEDYFIALGSIGIVVIGLLYFLDKKNVFKRI